MKFQFELKKSYEFLLLACFLIALDLIDPYNFLSN